MSTSSVQCWLVERTVDDRNLVTLVYAPVDGRRYHQRERSPASLRNGSPVTAGTTLEDAALEPVEDEETAARYAAEAERIADRYDPDDPL